MVEEEETRNSRADLELRIILRDCKTSLHDVTSGPAGPRPGRGLRRRGAGGREKSSLYGQRETGEERPGRRENSSARQKVVIG